jgi:peptidoglycan/LPS O-acetylase OafA/YrhL
VLIVLDGAAVIATYSRFQPALLYNVVHSNTVAAGFGRELVALNFPFALVGIALVGLAWPRLHGLLRSAGIVAIALCAVVYFAVDQSDLDAKVLNAAPALGLALAVVLVLAVGVPSAPRTRRGDGVRIGLAAVLLFFCAPLIAAEIGFFLDGVPFLGWFYETGG